MVKKISEHSSSRVLILLSALGLVGFVGWSAYAEIDQVSRASGQIIPSGRVQILQTMDGGEISRILVHEGDPVKKGQLLVELDRVKVKAAVDDGVAKVVALKTLKARVEAELFDRPLVFAHELDEFPNFEANQKQLYWKRRNAYSQDMLALKKMLALTSQELEMNRPLQAYGDVSKSEILRLQRSVVDVEEQISGRRNKYLQDLQTDYTKAEEDLVSAEQILKQRQASHADTELKASADGIVKNVRLTTIGAVLRPGDEVLQIVPVNEKMILEVKVSPADIAHVKVGQTASVKFDAYDSSIYGPAVGVVTYISPDTLTEQKGAAEQTYYRVHIDVDASKLRPHRGEQIRIQPGMTATTEILTGRNTVLKFMFKPIIKTLGESLGER